MPYYGYQPNYYQPPMQDQLGQLRQQQYPQQQQSIIWVTGEQEAMGYLVAPNSAVALWDSSSPTIYLKQADASGKPTMKTYDLVERRPVQVQKAPEIEYATRADLEALAKKTDTLMAQIEALTKEDKSNA